MVVDISHHDGEDPNNGEGFVVLPSSPSVPRLMGVEIEPTSGIVKVGPEDIGAFRLTDESTILEARQVHARAYFDHGLVTDEAIREDDTLIEEIDPTEIVNSSVYVSTIEGGLITGCMRIIEPINGGADSLPTMEKLSSILGPDHPVLKELPFIQDRTLSVCEVSALSKASQSKDPLVIAKLLLAALIEAKRLHYDYGVMGIVESVSVGLVKAFGSKAYRRVDDDTALIRLEGKGINPKGVTLVPFYVDVSTLLDDCLEHFALFPDKLSSIACKPLFKSAQTFLENGDHNNHV